MARLLPVLALGIAMIAPSALIPRPVEFVSISVAPDMTVREVHARDGDSLVNRGDLLVGISGKPLLNRDELDASLKAAPRHVPVRIARGPISEIVVGPEILDGQTPVALRNPYRVLAIDEHPVWNNPSVEDLKQRVREAPAETVRLRLTPASQVLDGDLQRTPRWPTTIEWIALATALLLILLIAAFLGRSALGFWLGPSLLVAAGPYATRFVAVDEGVWPLYVVAALGLLGLATLLVSVFFRREASGEGGPSRKAGRCRSARIDQSRRARGGSRSRGATLELLQAVGAVVDDAAQPALIVGFNRSAVRVSAADNGEASDSQLRVSIAEPQLHAGLAMLSLEGGTFPRAQSVVGGTTRDPEDDPFTGLQERLRIRLAAPLASFGDGAHSWAFLALFAQGDEPLDPATLTRSVEVLDELARPEIYAELKGLAADELLRALESDSTRADAPLRPSTSPPGGKNTRAPQAQLYGASLAGAANVRNERFTSKRDEKERHGTGRNEVEARRSDAYIRQLEDKLTLDYPVENEQVLSKSQWRLLDAVMDDDARPYLLVGEPGTGKELRARLVHRHSPRRTQRIATMDCMRQPPSVAMARLLGGDGEPGVIDAIAGGTLILKSGGRALGAVALDEVVARCVARNVRLACAERHAVEAQRLPATIPASLRHLVGSRWVSVPALHQIPGETLRIARHLVHEFAIQHDRSVLGISDRAADVLENLEFAANVHELRAVCLAAVLRADGDMIETEQLLHATTGDASEVLAEVEADAEREDIAAALRETDGNKSEAARALGMSRGTLLRRLKKYNMM